MGRGDDFSLPPLSGTSGGTRRLTGVTEDMFADQEIRIVANRSLDMDGVSIYMVTPTHKANLNSLVFEPRKEGEALDPIMLCESSAQELMDSLYRVGLRPTGIKHTSETLSATNKHLDDMRAIVAGTMKALNIEIRI